MGKIRSIHGDALVKVMSHRSTYSRNHCGDKATDVAVTKPKAKLYAPVSEARSNTGMSFKHMPVNARPPNWCPDSVRDREERLAMLVDGDLKGEWRNHWSGTRCDPKITRATRKQRAATGMIRGMLKK